MSILLELLKQCLDLASIKQLAPTASNDAFPREMMCILWKNLVYYWFWRGWGEFRILVFEIEKKI